MALELKQQLGIFESEFGDIGRAAKATIESECRFKIGDGTRRLRHQHGQPPAAPVQRSLEKFEVPHDLEGLRKLDSGFRVSAEAFELDKHQLVSGHPILDVVSRKQAQSPAQFLEGSFALFGMAQHEALVHQHLNLFPHRLRRNEGQSGRLHRFIGSVAAVEVDQQVGRLLQPDSLRHRVVGQLRQGKGQQQRIGGMVAPAADAVAGGEATQGAGEVGQGRRRNGTLLLEQAHQQKYEPFELGFAEACELRRAMRSLKTIPSRRICRATAAGSFACLRPFRFISPPLTVAEKAVLAGTTLERVSARNLWPRSRRTCDPWSRRGRRQPIRLLHD